MSTSIAKEITLFLQFARNIKLWLILGVDALFIIIAHFTAYLLRFEWCLTEEQFDQALAILPLLLLVKRPIFYLAGLYKGMWRFTSLLDIQNIIKAVVISSVIIVAVLLYTMRFEGLSRSVYIVDALLTFNLIGSLR
ncbi:MAG: hypothetical protein KAI17_09260, partial [Thiotrichaceae bacterium]|nr:hypothetical protein [Thiotrichaceae bacterium]